MARRIRIQIVGVEGTFADHLITKRVLPIKSTVFEPQFTGIRSNRSTNCAAETAHETVLISCNFSKTISDADYIWA